MNSICIYIYIYIYLSDTKMVLLDLYFGVHSYDYNFVTSNNIHEEKFMVKI
jgi:hypothetical protein